ncbi:efflux transporter outer membrane subunit [uncultured Desulfobulbus sp.]|uniref:efflux transporter outer membrane subunit n=1 Tax=uncultured Desulfobulbus sp. TaxID=239745 RepID=UPI00261ADF6B|nr:efflux transporter outer membrane subunit [uncultured Desulfobulbus sp.]
MPALLDRCRRGACVAALLAVALGGCAAVGPDYSEPQLAVPAGWSAGTGTDAMDAVLLARWWHGFGDPVLDRLVADALAANLDLAQARARLREARARRGVAGAALAPSVDASLSGSRSRSSGQSGSGSTRELYSAGFDASWELDVFGGVRRSVEAAQADLEASVESLSDTRVSLAAEVALNYIDLRTAEQRLAIAEESIAYRGENHQIIRWRQQAGLVSELDLAQATTDLESTRAVLPPLRTAVTEAKNRLAVLLGRNPGELESLVHADRPIPLAAAEIVAAIPADTLRQRPDVRVAERRLAAQTARLGEAEAARYPSFRLSGSLGLEALELDALADRGANTHSLFGGITAPVFNAGRIAANIEIQDALVEQARLAYRAAVLAALEEVENALTAVANTDARRAKLAEAAAAARTTLAIAEYRYASGLADFLSVLDAQRTQLSLDEQLAGSTGELARAQIRLYKALGGGWSTEPLPAKEPQ